MVAGKIDEYAATIFLDNIDNYIRLLVFVIVLLLKASGVEVRKKTVACHANIQSWPTDTAYTIYDPCAEALHLLIQSIYI